MMRIALIAACAGVMALVIVATTCFLGLLEFVGVPPFYAWQQKHMVKRVLAANPDALETAGRQLLATHPSYVGEINPSSPDIPHCIRRLKPTRISFTTNAVWVDFSDVFNPFGIVVYRVGADPPATPEYGGLRKWKQGIWLYHDGQLDALAQPPKDVKNQSAP